jgi:hypothetical protein
MLKKYEDVVLLLHSITEACACCMEQRGGISILSLLNRDS